MINEYGRIIWTYNVRAGFQGARIGLPRDVAVEGVRHHGGDVGQTHLDTVCGDQGIREGAIRRGICENKQNIFNTKIDKNMNRFFNAYNI